MGFEFFIASRLKLGNNEKAGSPSLNVALLGIILAIVIMILSVVIVLGFKNEITTKINNLDSHIKISNGAIGIDDNIATVDMREIANALNQDSAMLQNIEDVSLIAEKPAILKTDSDFKGLQFRGVGANFDFSFLKSHLLEGRVPTYENSDSTQEIIISSTIANQLQLNVNDKILTYFIDEKVKVRNCHIVGIFNTDFESFDKNYIVGNIALLQSVNDWKAHTGNYVGVKLKNIDNIDDVAYSTFGTLATYSISDNDNSTVYNVTSTHQNNISYFTWLSMLDMNVVIILVLMIIVSTFTLISALLMIILERIKMIGLFKALGASNHSIRRIFIYLTHKIIFKSIIIGNVIGIGLALLQQHFHIIKLNPDAYYMNYVPIDINVPMLIFLNVAIIVISYITLIGPSYIISSIKPSSTMRFE
ncbi:MAG: ABC transporter permease [Muribaculaceae bacterium]|nr:ABC transporter permease [Muribaculaceae bacterium]